MPRRIGVQYDMEANELLALKTELPATPLDRKLFREKLLRLEREMQCMEGEHIQPDLRHVFAPGVYIRELRLAAGTLVTGKIHKTEHTCILAEGSCTVLTEFGRMDIEAPYTWVSPPGTKRAVYAYEDCLWINVHPNPDNETDPEKIEARVVAQSYDELLSLDSPGETLSLEEN